MGRKRRDYLRHIEAKVNAWAIWHIRYIDEGGYPSATVEARLMEGGASERPPPASKVPNSAFMPRDVADIEHAYLVMPPPLAGVLFRHYRKGEKESYRRLTEALTWLAGRGL